MNRQSKKRYKIFALMFFVTVIFFSVFLLLYKNISRLEDVLSVSLFRDKNYSLLSPEVVSFDGVLLEKKLVENNFVIENRGIASGSSSLFVKIKDGPFVFFSQSKDLGGQISSLRTILKKLTIENRKPARIDFGKNAPIVNF